MRERLVEVVVEESESLEVGIKRLDESGLGVLFVVDEHGKMRGVLTDGDLRRAVLRGAGLASLLRESMRRDFIFARSSVGRDEATRLLTEQIRHVPILDEAGRPVDFVTWHEFPRVPVVDLTLEGHELAYVTDCLKTNWISSQGRYVKRFEEHFREFLDVPHALTTSSGTAALQLALAALDIGAGDEVVVPDLTFGACGNVVVRAGATPVFCDVDRGRWLMEPASVAALLTPRTKAIMVVHLYGHACEMAPIQELARAHGVAVIEDCAEALGPKYQGERVGRFGDVACFSFFANKVITTGEGGMVTTRQAALHERMKLLRDHGMRPERRYWHEAAGFNFRLTNVQAAIGVAQLERIEGSLLHRRAVVRRYESGLHGLPGVALPQRVDWADDVDWLFSVVVDETRAGVDRDTLAARLARQGVDTRPFFSALHEQPAFRSGRTGDCSNASWLAQRGLSLPTSSYIPLEHVDRVCSAVRGAIGGGTGPARPLRG